jgi:hypothetical protein
MQGKCTFSPSAHLDRRESSECRANAHFHRTHIPSRKGTPSFSQAALCVSHDVCFHWECVERGSLPKLRTRAPTTLSPPRVVCGVCVVACLHSERAHVCNTHAHTQKANRTQERKRQKPTNEPRSRAVGRWVFSLSFVRSFVCP